MIMTPPSPPVTRWTFSLTLAMFLAAITGAAALAAPVETKPGATIGAPLPGASLPLASVDQGDAKPLQAWLGGGAAVKTPAKATVIAFLSCRCPYVAQARANLAALARTYAPSIAFLGLNANQNEPAVDVKTDAAANYPFPMLRDEGSKVADALGAERTPEIFVVDRAGVVRYHGGVADLEPALAALAAGKPVAKAESKAFGCTIKRKP